MSTLLFILGLVLFIGLVVVHEWGHFMAARRGGVEIEEFGIFFPPRLYKHRTRAGWLFTINLLPLGGFVKLKGEHDTDIGRGSYGAASLAVKSRIMAAGVFMNLVAAFVLFMILAWIGMPHMVPNQFTVASDTTYVHRATYHTVAGQVEPGSPAAHVGLRSGDAILAIGPSGHLTNLAVNAGPAELTDLTNRYAGKTIELKYEHSGEQLQKAVTLRSNADVAAAAKQGKDIGHLGVAVYPTQDGLTVARSTWSAPIVAGGTMGQLTGLTFEGLGKAVAGLGSTLAGAVTGNHAARENGQTTASGQVTGPIGIYFVFKYGATLGFNFILMVVALLSLALAVMNILPIPALDGGRLWITLATRAFGRPLSARLEERITATGFAVLIAIIIAVSVVDVKRFL
ncbi:MAG TPA: M50 family metallopeptidase [Candidatus Saccharimonadales bacterium]